MPEGSSFYGSPGTAGRRHRRVEALVIVLLVVGVGVLGYNLYQARKQPEGVQINLGPNGLKIESK